MSSTDTDILYMFSTREREWDTSELVPARALSHDWEQGQRNGDEE